jgi:two-component system, response regulator
MTEQRAEILLVEDNPNDVKLTLNAFKTANLANSVHVARDGVEALEFLFGAASPGDKLPERPRLILLDLKLPRLDGHEVLKRIKGDPRTSAIPVVVLTSSAEERDVMRTYEVGELHRETGRLRAIHGNGARILAGDQSSALRLVSSTKFRQRSGSDRVINWPAEFRLWHI